MPLLHQKPGTHPLEELVSILYDCIHISEFDVFEQGCRWFYDSNGEEHAKGYFTKFMTESDHPIPWIVKDFSKKVLSGEIPFPHKGKSILLA